MPPFPFHLPLLKILRALLVHSMSAVSRGDDVDIPTLSAAEPSRDGKMELVTAADEV